MREIGSWFGLTSVDQASASVVVVGCPFEDSVTGRAGAAGGPAAIRRWSGTAEAIDERGRPIEGLTVHDAGDASARGDRASAIRTAAGGVRPDQFLLGLGGDHGVTPSLLGVMREQHPDLALVVLDAHPDLFPHYEGDRDSHACAVARAWDEVGVEPGYTALVGLRSYARPELEPLTHAGAVVSAAEWAAIGAAGVADQIAAVAGDRPVYVSLDIDVLDPSCAPGTGYPVAGGPTSRELLTLLSQMWSRLRIVGLDLVEVAPALDPAELTAPAAAQLLLQVLGLVAADRIRG
jgi:agmatinase